MKIPSIIAQVDPSASLSLMQNLGAAGWAVVLVVLFFVWRELSRIERNMVTKDGLSLALADMRKELRDWAEGRFQTKTDAAKESDGQARAISNLRRDFIDSQRQGDHG